MQLGARALVLRDPVQGAAIPLHLIYPTETPATPQAFGPPVIELALLEPEL